jgi:hypothetical protein
MNNNPNNQPLPAVVTPNRSVGAEGGELWNNIENYFFFGGSNGSHVEDVRTTILVHDTFLDLSPQVVEKTIRRFIRRKMKQGSMYQPKLDTDPNIYALH